MRSVLSRGASAARKLKIPRRDEEIKYNAGVCGRSVASAREGEKERSRCRKREREREREREN